VILAIVGVGIYFLVQNDHEQRRVKEQSAAVERAQAPDQQAPSGPVTVSQGAVAPKVQAQPIPGVPEGGTDAEQAKRVARNFNERYAKLGMAGIKSSVQTCYAATTKSLKERSMQYCFLLDLVASTVDAETATRLGLAQEPYWSKSAVWARALAAVSAIQPNSSIASDMLSRWSAGLPIAMQELSVVLAAAARPISVGDALPYLFEQMTKPTYRGALTAILNQAPPLPPWIASFVQTRNGTAMPGKLINIEGANFELYEVCEPHNCGGNFLYVIFSPGGGRAWALATKDYEALALLGAPTPAQIQALQATAREDSQYAPGRL
jgi:hypothetical protein